MEQGTRPFKSVTQKEVLGRILLSRQQGSPGPLPGPPPAEVSMAPSLEEPFAQHPTASAEPAVGRALGEARPGGMQHRGPGARLTGLCAVSVDTRSFEGRHPGISFLPCLQPHTLQSPSPQVVYLFVYSPNICRADVPGTDRCQGMKLDTPDPVPVPLELTAKQKGSFQCLLFSMLRTFP